ncbi:MAG: hypothetical protein KME26_26805 [Oscillatoria princeps RMCB-10]|nr:hypothetical protein [Oscillatoria princeps RMCB-10]
MQYGQMPAEWPAQAKAGGMLLVISGEIPEWIWTAAKRVADSEVRGFPTPSGVF